MEVIRIPDHIIIRTFETVARGGNIILCASIEDKKDGVLTIYENISEKDKRSLIAYYVEK